MSDVTPASGVDPRIAKHKRVNRLIDAMLIVNEVASDKSMTAGELWEVLRMEVKALLGNTEDPMTYDIVDSDPLAEDKQAAALDLHADAQAFEIESQS